MRPQATAVQDRAGAWTVSAACRECSKPLTLPCRTDEGTMFEPDEFALKWADMLICDQCSAIWEGRRTERDAAAGMSERVKESGVPSSFQDLRFDDMDRSGTRGQAISAAWAWADEGGGLLLYGPVGTGKSRLAGTATWARLQRRPVAWCSVAHVIASLQAAFDDKDRRQAVRVLTGRGALVLDDLDKVKPSEWVLSQLFVAIDRRVNAGAPLLVTANVAPTQLSAKFGDPLTSRLLGYCQAFLLDGTDRRLTGDRREQLEVSDG